MMEKHKHQCGNCSESLTHGEADDDLTCEEFIQEITTACENYDDLFGERPAKFTTDPLEVEDEK